MGRPRTNQGNLSFPDPTPGVWEEIIYKKMTTQDGSPSVDGGRGGGREEGTHPKTTATDSSVGSIRV